VSARGIALLAFLLLAAVFVVDVLTPQTLIVAILLSVPIVITALTRDRRLTIWVVAIALIADVVAAFLNAARDNYRWDPIGVTDRALTIVSIVLVGYLTTVVQDRAERVGRFEAQDLRARREARLSAAVGRIRSSLSRDLVVRSIVREAPSVLEGDAARWRPARFDEAALSVQAGSDEVTYDEEPLTPAFVSLVQRALDDGEPRIIRYDDAVARLVLDELGGRGGVMVPVQESGVSFGVLLIWSKDDVFDEQTLTLARVYGRAAAAALAQAQLFDQLAERNAALSERSAVIRDLVYALSHDLRTPLAALSMTLQQAQDGAYGALPDAYRSVLNNSIVAVNDLQRLAETLLIVARFESGERSPERELVDVALLVNQLGVELSALASARQIHLVVKAAETAVVRGDRGDLRRAIANLVANAIENTPQDGTVELSVVNHEPVVEIVVSDDGFGVDQRIRTALFERFGSTASRAGGGTGLGLYIVRRIAEEEGGSVRYEPRDPRGSQFTISLPAAA